MDWKEYNLMAMHVLVPAAGIKGQLFSVKQLISNWKENDLLTLATFLASTPVKSSRKVHVSLSNRTYRTGSGVESEVVVRAQDSSQPAWLERAEAGPCYGGDWISSPGSL